MDQEQFRKTLSREFHLRRSKNPKYSLRAFARDIKISPATVCQVFEGKRSVSRKLATKVADEISVSPSEKKKILSSPASGEKQVLDDLKFSMVSEWYYFAVLSLAETPSYIPKDKHISQRLGISLRQARKALANLKKLGFLSSKGFLANPVVISTQEDIASRAIRLNHRQGLDLAEEALSQVPVESREFTSETIAMDPEDLDKFKREIRKFRSKCQNFANKSKKTEVFRLQIQMFPVSKPKGGS